MFQLVRANNIAQASLRELLLTPKATS